MENSSGTTLLPNPQYGISLQSIVPIRREPLEQSEMVSQLLFGEYYQVEEILKKWLYITTLFDNYSGWIDQKIFQEISPEEYFQQKTKKPYVLASKMAEIILHGSSSQVIPAGSNLPGFNEDRKIITLSDRELEILPLFGEIMLSPAQHVAQTALLFLNAPYLWGGRSVFGLDCSGFVQTVFKIHGIALPRDASQQADSGKDLHTLDETKPGDLAFFAMNQEKISHVGIILSPREIIHCSGWVRIDSLDSSGILNRSTGMHTHRLRALRRISEYIK